MMGGFRDSKTIYDEQKEKRRPYNWEPPLPEAPHARARQSSLIKPLETAPRVCEYFTLKGCKASLEAFELGLSEKIFICVGNVPPLCSVRQKLLAGMTIQEIYNHPPES